MKFDKVNHIMLLGGSRIVAELSKLLKEDGQISFSVFTAPRQIKDTIYDDKTTLGGFFKKHDIDHVVTDDINTCKEFLDSITGSTLGIGMGEAWPFKAEVIQKFDGRLLDLMGIRLPQYRGGAHYTWQILRGNRIGACNLQVINEEMNQGVFDSGQIVFFKEYLFSQAARIPNDYFNEAVVQEINFIMEFIDKVNEGYEFRPFILQENFSIYFPRLYTIKNAFLDWQWDTVDVDRFICAFDDPYPGCTTFLNGRKVYLKKSCIEFNDGPFHAFQCGLIYKIFDGVIYVATKQGTILIKSVLDSDWNDITQELKTGDRFYTPKRELELAMTTKIEI